MRAPRRRWGKAWNGRDGPPFSSAVVFAGHQADAKSLYWARNSGRVRADVAEVLTPIVRAFEAGKLRSKRSSPRSRHPNHWEIVET
jgi:hypothetical protein